MTSDTTPQPQKHRPSSATAAAKGAGSFLLPETDSQSKRKTRGFPVGVAPSPPRDLVKRDPTDLSPFPDPFSPAAHTGRWGQRSCSPAFWWDLDCREGRIRQRGDFALRGDLLPPPRRSSDPSRRAQTPARRMLI